MMSFGNTSWNSHTTDGSAITSFHSTLKEAYIMKTWVLSLKDTYTFLVDMNLKFSSTSGNNNTLSKQLIWTWLNSNKFIPIITSKKLPGIWKNASYRSNDNNQRDIINETYTSNQIIWYWDIHITEGKHISTN